MPEKPSSRDVARALSAIDDVISHFPFTADADRAHAIALLILPFVREMISGCTPLHLFEAATPGSGKTLLAQTMLLPSSGRVGLSSIGRDEDEMRKRISTVLVRGSACVIFDNAKGRLDSAALCAVLTADEWSDRLLGTMQEIRVPNRATWCATGNNLALSNELARRTVTVRLVPDVECPSARNGFRHDPLLDYVEQRRPFLVQAALTLVQAWIAEGRPKGEGVMGSFESWAHVVGGILRVAGVPGFLGDRDRLASTTDEETAAWRFFTEQWLANHGTKDARVSELLALADATGIALGEGEYGRA